MELAIGALLNGKVKSITSFGAFITLPEGKTGLVHISEIASTYVSNIRDHLTEGQEVRVKVLAIDPAGKISLSIRRAQEPPAQPERKADRRGEYHKPSSAPRKPAAPKEPLTFEEKLKQFMSDADSNLSSNRLYADRRSRGRRR